LKNPKTMNNLFCKILDCMKYGLFSAFWLMLFAVSTASGQGIQLSFDITEPSCNGYTNGTATVNPAGGTSPYSYSWNNGQSGQTNFGLGAGAYSVTVTDLNGQTAAGSVTVTQPAPLTVDITAAGLSCTSASGTLTANPAGGTQPYAYSWSTNQSTQQIQVSSAGTYFVTVTDANGCSKITAYNVPPVAEFFPSYVFTMPKCHGESNGSIGITIFGTNPPFTWIWNTGVANQGLANIPAGDYSLTVTDSKGCTFADTVHLMDNPQLIVEVMVTNVACATLPNGGSVFAAVAGGVSPYTYLWNNNNTQAGQQNLPEGTYTVTVTDKNGCTAAATGTITTPPPLTAEVVSNSPACGGNNGCVTVQGAGGTPPYTYVWPVLGISGPTACGLAPGDYYVCIYDANGCQHDLIVTVDSSAGLDVQLISTKAACPRVDTGTATAIVNPPTGVYNADQQHSGRHRRVRHRNGRQHGLRRHGYRRGRGAQPGESGCDGYGRQLHGRQHGYGNRHRLARHGALRLRLDLSRRRHGERKQYFRSCARRISRCGDGQQGLHSRRSGRHRRAFQPGCQI